MGELRIENGRVIDSDEGARVNISFYEHSKKVGIGRYEPRDYIKVRAAGVKDFMSRPVTEDDKVNHSKEWAAYQGGRGNAEEGETPLTLLPSYKLAYSMELKLGTVESIEALASKPKPDFDYLVPMWKEARMFMALKDANKDEEEHEEG